MRYPADPARILAWGLRRLAQRTARPRQLNPTTNHESQLHRRDSIDHDSRRSPAVFNLSVHSNTGGRLRLYLDLDRHAHGPESRDLARHQEPCRQWRGRWKGWRGGIRPWPRDSSRKDAVGNEQHHGSGTERLLAQTGAVALEHHREIEKDARESKPPKHLDRDISNVVSRALGAGTIEEPREVHIRRTANIEQDGCANHVVPLLLKKNSHDKQGGSTSTTRSTTGTEGESAVIYAEPDTANADFSVTRQADPCRDQSAVQTSNVVQTSQYSDEPEPSAPLANVISTSGRAGEPLEPTTAPEYSHEAPARTPRAKPRFRSCKSKYKANVHQKLLDPVSRSDAMEGSIYIFRHASADGMVKIGCTLQPVARRLQNWTRSCGEEAVLVHATGIMEFARRAEALIHQELGAERREEPLCRGCGRAHNEWFKIASGRARQVVDDWARIVYRHGLYDADRQLDASWARVLRTLRWENVDITAHSLLRRYEELMADKSSNDVVEADRGKVVGETLPVLRIKSDGIEEVPLQGCQFSPAPRATVGPDLTQTSLLQTPADLSSLVKDFIESPLEGTTQSTPGRETSDQETGVSVLLLASPRAPLQLASPPTLLLPAPSATDFHYTQGLAVASEASDPMALDNSLVVRDTGGVVQRTTKLGSNDLPRTARKCPGPGFFGVLLTLVAIDAYFVAEACRL